MILFKLPFNDKYYSVHGNSSETAISVVSFDEFERLDFKGNIVEIKKEEILQNQKFSDEINSEILDFKQESKDEYLTKLKEVIDFINENSLQKLVYSRQKINEFPEKKINLSQTFLNLCENYPNAFVYFFLDNGVCWIGAFSEILGIFNKKNKDFETMSLAGTLPVKENWTEKEIEEQKPVSDYILKILEKYNSKIHSSETYDHISGDIKHLRTDFKIKTEEKYLENLISELHPTPAVCGIPRDFCKKAIANFERYPREFYAGYIRIEKEEDILYFVNLRCAKFYKNATKLFVGGGITTLSIPEKEWQETELKSQAILKNLAFYS
ncbi:chorismate-binding protein [Chryseobacterium sp.]|uniref:chorismate-binding protein n=1 Tax=Chryseobacterium sp. TaxID=1871047 RepID=UPI0011C9E3B6|nr:chorismate-binding protein [Chryseobacterium sp.]TXF79341.1 hypothetical protein FUA25_02850 [Chryseobacterium sp.]